MLQIVQDIMVSENWLLDDNCDEMLPIPYMKNNKYYSVDKNKPGVYITVL